MAQTAIHRLKEKPLYIRFQEEFDKRAKAEEDERRKQYEEAVGRARPMVDQKRSSSPAKFPPIKTPSQQSSGSGSHSSNTPSAPLPPINGKVARRQLGSAGAAVRPVVLQQRARTAEPLRAVSSVPGISVEEKGPKETLDYRVYFKNGEKKISCWHEIPLFAGDGLLHFICEIPKESSAKMEVATDEVCTPIKQDTKKGKLRYYPYNINWNYGLLPQTWEDPQHQNTDLGAAGDNDPVDVVEIGSEALQTGGVYKVKPLGVYAMIDEGEVDWKIIAINAEDPKAALLNDVSDVETHMPGELEKIMVWFRDYKTPDGKPQNAFGYDNKCMDKAFTMKVIEETHGFYTTLKSGARPNSEELSLL